MKRTAQVMTQKQIFRIVDKVASAKYVHELDLLSSVMREIVDRADIEISGGRIWELDPLEDAYTLRYQYGSLETVPENYTVTISEYPMFAELPARRTIMNYETDEVLMKTGIRLYSATGIGELSKRKGAKYFPYVLAFNAPQISDKFFDMINIIGSAVSIRLRDLERQQQQRVIEKDLSQASEIQKGLLPDHETIFHDYHIFGISIPDRIVGGDYFDYLRPPNNYEERLSVLVSDASSKGMAAAIQALFVSGAIRMGIGFDLKMASLLSRLNTLIYETFPYERFVTLFYCELIPSDKGLLLFANAGHCNPIHYRAKTRDFYLLPTTGSMLGISPDQRFRIENINMAPGDILLLYTDGIIEAQNKHGKLFGENRLKSILRKMHTKTPREIGYHCIEEAQKFSVGAEDRYTDDKTLVVIKRMPPGSDEHLETGISE
ncbi:MAG: serine/threonine-protein phosphatase [Candidatus Kapabacteria bacterium]|jgi:sigma-B regulation protein RsbU (phosphoserine phosphatase)|nr:serine/threonine-protein phosphatase [Candidatus Kapabacteria bacterium]